MTRLRKMMLEELQRRNFSEDTIRHYIHTVEDFARHFNRPPDRLGLRHIREYQAHLFQKRKLSSGSVTNHLAALRFFYIQTASGPVVERPLSPNWRQNRSDSFTGIPVVYSALRRIKFFAGSDDFIVMEPLATTF